MNTDPVFICVNPWLKSSGLKMKYLIFALFLVIAQGTSVFAQHEGHKTPPPAKPASTPAAKPAATPAATPQASPATEQPAAEQPAAEESMHMDHGVFVMHDD